MPQLDTLRLLTEAHTPDDDLVACCLAGTPSAFATLYGRHARRVAAIVRPIVRNEADVQEVMQEAFTAAYAKLDSYKGGGAFSGWLSQIARNAALMRVRRRKRRPESPLGWEEDGEWVQLEPVDPQPSVEGLLIAQRTRQELQRAVDALSPTQREVYLLAQRDALSMLEIARVLNLTVPNTKTRLHRARKTIRRHVAEYLREGAQRAA